MMGLDIGLVILALASLVTVYRMLFGPTDADRAVAADLLTFGIIGLITLGSLRVGGSYTFDLVLVAVFVAFLSSLSLARAISGGKR